MINANIAITIIGITLTLIAVYTPILFLGSDISQLLKPFALTLASAVLISGIVALKMQKPIEWDGHAMKVIGHPEADAFVGKESRSEWL